MRKVIICSENMMYGKFVGNKNESEILFASDCEENWGKCVIREVCFFIIRD